MNQATTDLAALSDAALSRPQDDDDVITPAPTTTSSSSAETPSETPAPVQEKQTPAPDDVLAQMLRFWESYSPNTDPVTSPLGDAGAKDHAPALPPVNPSSGGGGGGGGGPEGGGSGSAVGETGNAPPAPAAKLFVGRPSAAAARLAPLGQRSGNAR